VKIREEYGLEGEDLSEMWEAIDEFEDQVNDLKQELVETLRQVAERLRDNAKPEEAPAA
jgi:hypothetical protein